MTYTNTLIELVKQKQGLTSDYGVAKLLNVTPQKMSDWRRGRVEANAESTLKLVVAAGLTAEDALSIVTERPATTGGALSRSAREMYIMLNRIRRGLRLKLMFDSRQTLALLH